MDEICLHNFIINVNKKIMFRANVQDQSRVTPQILPKLVEPISIFLLSIIQMCM